MIARHNYQMAVGCEMNSVQLHMGCSSRAYSASNAMYITSIASCAMNNVQLHMGCFQLIARELARIIVRHNYSVSNNITSIASCAMNSAQLRMGWFQLIGNLLV